MVTASAGNHALGLAAAAAELGARARIFVPASADEAKLARLRAYRAPVEVVLVDGTYDETERAARAAVAHTPGAEFVSSYNDPDVVAGQGTIALELLEQWPDVEAVVVPVGGGGLIGGIGVALAGIAPSVRLIGAEPAAAPALTASLARGRVASIPDGSSSVAEALVGNLDADTITVPLAVRSVDEMVLVDEHQLAAATARLYDAEAIVAEPSGVAGVAALAHARALRGLERVACVVSGRNIAGRRHRDLVARSAARERGAVER
jgi:threonine dehydratase